MKPSLSQRLHASDGDRRRGADRFARAFALHLRAASPPLANLIDDACGPGSPYPAAIITAAVIAQANGDLSCEAASTFAQLRASGQRVARADVLLGRALLASLGDLLGSDFDSVTHDAWTNGYVALVEAVMAKQRGRLDRVA